MKFFLDTANLEQIKEAQSLGILDGVTTNPSLMAKEGIKGIENIKKHYADICEIVDGDVSAEVLSTTYEEMIKEGQELADINPQITVKLPCTIDGIKAVKYFSSRGIKTNCTLVFSVGQALLAAKAGATYVSPFVGRLDDISTDGIGLVAQIVDVYNTYGYQTQVLAASIRHTQHIIQCLEVGADVATCPLKAILGLINHPLTDKGLATFISDAAKMV
ncbi:MAG: fructose-6-phosphate aldolase [Bacteroidales bacterium]|jgi:transaldolase|nr:fructose-6-phosphate aldolase [Bacteroidales bacterium]MBO7248888.1 fructose-6-phosphate aldolase [Bacteroidales bacterium]MBO7320728.1 fructose-6-phosphate aldolase [Bacteroidales bacterium]MBO7764132.1 fructose-6-phosphate aldolase [Bacteroidales bacterium]